MPTSIDTVTIPLGIVAALPGEARSLARVHSRGRATLPGGSQLLLSGMGADNARLAARQLANRGAAMLVSWGVAAALDTKLVSGTLALPEMVMADDGNCYTTDAAARQALMACFDQSVADVVEGTLVEAPGVLVSPADKSALFEQSGALVSDMESAAIGRVAGEQGLAFLVIRVVVDDANMTLPPVAREAVDSDGRLRPVHLAASLVGRPGSIHAQLRSLKNLAVAYRSAQMTLKAVAPWIVNFESMEVSS